MKIKVNGIAIEFYKTSLMDLVVQYRFNPDKIVVERNGAVVSPESYPAIHLQDGDLIDIARSTGKK